MTNNLSMIFSADVSGKPPTDFSNDFRKFEQFSQLNSGGKADLIVCRDSNLGRPVVLKKLRKDVANYDKELSAQGVGNIACGLVGALPMTGVIVRSSANVASGAKTRYSTILHGFWLLIFVALLPQVLGFIPRAALGALLVHIGIKLLNLKQIPPLWKTSRSEVAIFAATFLVIVCEDLLVGVVVGIMLSAAKLLYRFSHLELQLTEKDNVCHLEMQGAATFLRLPLLAATLENVPDSAELHVDFKHLSYVDHACLDLLMNWQKQHEGQGGKLVIDWSSLHGRFSEDPDENLKRVKSGTASAANEEVLTNA